MDPDHDALAPASPPHAQGLAADLALLIGHTVQLALLLFQPALDVLVLARRPLLLSTLVNEFGAVLLKCHNGKERKLVVVVDFDT